MVRSEQSKYSTIAVRKAWPTASNANLTKAREAVSINEDGWHRVWLWSSFLEQLIGCVRPHADAFMSHYSVNVWSLTFLWTNDVFRGFNVC
jgi:hypothetical protein